MWDSEIPQRGQDSLSGTRLCRVLDRESWLRGELASLQVRHAYSELTTGMKIIHTIIIQIYGHVYNNEHCILNDELMKTPKIQVQMINECSCT